MTTSDRSYTVYKRTLIDGEVLKVPTGVKVRVMRGDVVYDLLPGEVISSFYTSTDGELLVDWEHTKFLQVLLTNSGDRVIFASNKQVGVTDNDPRYTVTRPVKDLTTPVGDGVKPRIDPSFFKTVQVTVCTKAIHGVQGFGAEKLEAWDAYISATIVGGSDQARRDACKDPVAAYQYALDIDGGPHWSTRMAASANPEQAYLYSSTIDFGPSNECRTGACNDPYWARHYATKIDCKPLPETRNAVLGSPQDSYLYAVGVDRGPRDDTRLAACMDPRYAADYAELVDCGYSRLTYGSVLGSKYFLRYMRHILLNMDYAEQKKLIPSAIFDALKAVGRV